MRVPENRAIADRDSRRSRLASAALERPDRSQLRELHIELSALEVVRRGESVVAMGWLADSPQGSNQREFEAAADNDIGRPSP